MQYNRSEYRKSSGEENNKGADISPQKSSEKMQELPESVTRKTSLNTIYILFKESRSTNYDVMSTH